MSKRKWTNSNIPDQTGRLVIVTGANSGIGYETAKALAAKNATVIVASRNAQKGEAAVDTINAKNGTSNARFMSLDLASLASVRTFAGQFKTHYDRLDVLINNAGVMMPPYGLTEDGFELQFGINHLGHFALTGLLIDRILQTNNSRVVTVSSSAHNWGQVNFDDLNSEQKYDKVRAYGQSKIANLYFTYELQRKLTAAGAHTIATAAHPGWTATNLQRHAGLFRFFNPIFGQKMDMGALPTLMAAVGPAKGADYFGPGGFMEARGYPKKVHSNELSHDKDIAARLWSISEELSGVKFSL